MVRRHEPVLACSGSKTRSSDWLVKARRTWETLPKTALQHQGRNELPILVHCSGGVFAKLNEECLSTYSAEIGH